MLPRNAPALVDSALELLQLTGHEAFWWTPSSQGAARGLSSLHPTANPSSSSPATNTNSTSNGPAGAENAASPAANSAADVLRLPLSSRDVLVWLVDLSALPPMRLVAALAAECPCPPEAAALQRMATEACYKEQVSLQIHGFYSLLRCCACLKRQRCELWQLKRATKIRWVCRCHHVL